VLSKQEDMSSKPRAQNSVRGSVCARPLKLIYKPAVLDAVGVSYPTLWKWMRQGVFPRSREVGNKVCWFEHEVQEWLANRPIKKLKGDA
jgi:predicted DNA-binding transcriptional regulator AlpA